MTRRRDRIIALLLLLAVVGTTFVLWGLPKGFGKKKVALVEVRGTISDPGSVVRQLRKYTEDRSVAAIVLRIESPGGSVAASQEIYRAILRARERGKKVVASMGNVAASGGYYIAVAADTIVANPGTITGSIGVIAEFPNVEKLLEKLGLKVEVLKTGQYKDIGSPLRKMEEEEKKLVQEVLEDAYGQFLKAVSEGRGIPEDSLRPYADGRIFTGRQALSLGLVDVLGGYQDAVDLAGRMAGIGPNPPTVGGRRKGLLERFLGVLEARMEPIPTGVGLYYLFGM